MKLPTELTFTVTIDDEDVDVNVRFDFNRGEAQWFDHRAGVGGPGEDASVEITEVDLGDGWKSPTFYKKLPIKQLEELVLDKLDELMARVDESVNSLGSKVEFSTEAEWRAALPKAAKVDTREGYDDELFAQAECSHFSGIAGRFKNGKGWIYAHYLKCVDLKENVHAMVTAFIKGDLEAASAALRECMKGKMRKQIKKLKEAKVTDEQLKQVLNQIGQEMKGSDPMIDMQDAEKIGRSWTVSLRDWGQWVMPDGVEDDGDYDWQVLSRKSMNDLNQLVTRWQAKVKKDGIKLMYQTGEKNWIYISAIAEQINEGFGRRAEWDNTMALSHLLDAKKIKYEHGEYTISWNSNGIARVTVDGKVITIPKLKGRWYDREETVIL